MPGGVAAVVVAAGRGTRTGGAVPKQYRLLDGAPVVRHALMRFVAHPEIDMVQPVIHRDDAPRFAQASTGLAIRDEVAVVDDESTAENADAKVLSRGQGSMNVQLHIGDSLIGIRAFCRVSALS